MSFSYYLPLIYTFLFSFFLSSVVKADADRKNCYGEKNKACFSLAHATTPIYSETLFVLSLFFEDAFVQIAPGLEWRFFKKLRRWDWNPNIGKFIGHFRFLYALTEDVVFGAGAFIENHWSIYRSAEVPKYLISPSKEHLAGGFLYGHLITYSSENSSLSFELKSSFSKSILPSPDFRLSKKDFDEVLTMTLVSSEPITRKDIKTFYQETSLVCNFLGSERSDEFLLYDDSEIGFVFIYNESGFYSFGGVAKQRFVLGFFPMKKLILDSFLEVHVKLSGRFTITKEAPLFVLPSHGGDYGMYTGVLGDGANFHAVNESFEIGPSFIRLFFEYGLTMGRGKWDKLMGYGAVLEFPRTIWKDLTSNKFIISNMTGFQLVFAGNTNEHFVFRALGGGSF